MSKAECENVGHGFVVSKTDIFTIRGNRGMKAENETVNKDRGRDEK